MTMCATNHSKKKKRAQDGPYELANKAVARAGLDHESSVGCYMAYGFLQGFKAAQRRQRRLK